MSKRGLGRGLQALIPNFDLEGSGEGAVQDVEIGSVKPNRYQPREKFDDEKMKELAASIREHGVVQPVLVRRTPEGLELVAGERRLRASEMAGLKRVPAIIQEFTDAQMIEVALIENLQREDLNCMEEARAYKRLVEEFGFTQDALARRVGKSRPEVSNTMRLLNLEDEIQEMLSNGEISYGHARALLSIEGVGRRQAAATIRRKGLSVREAERLTQQLLKGTKKKVGGARRDPGMDEIEEKIRLKLGTPVRIERNRKRGQIVIEYYGDEDLERILEIILEKPV